MKPSTRAFLAAFFCVLAVAGLAAGITVADRNTRLTGLRDNEPFLTVERTSELRYQLQLFGEEAELSLERLNTAVGYAQHFFCFVPPATRTLLRLSTLAL